MFSSMSMPEFYQKTKREPLKIIDVREKEEYDYGHVPTAVNLPLSELAESYPILEKDQEYFLICQTGSRSATACQFLGNKGYKAINVMGGTSAWMGQLEG
ncbi:rhodanese-like domain-containing protein [Enterococcus italicus]|uniref:rhodanese-like domain-containing protein n=1 Tax=Enterococcus italicus TaxID=246144 RepID=UPI0020743F7A|nr:rhodanese-like domain-containing protein [Enterococcus italicus]